jgi:D12 class N6 adenine-specific DNA methyltransferase
MLSTDMKAPFPWFGGKRRVALEIWAAFGDVDNFVEPFAGSLAVLLERPAWHGGWQTGAETVNDADHYLANLWRAIVHAPDEVARHADWPVNETDLFARHLWLVSEGRERIARMEADPDHYDAKVAGWWLWGQCAWIGSGWCAGTGPWVVRDGAPVRLDEPVDGGVAKRQLPHLGDVGQGVNRKLPHLGSRGQGVNRQLPHLGDAGRGVNRQLLHLGDAGRGAVNGTDMTHGGSGAPSATWDRSHWCEGEEPLVYGYMRALQARLRRVRVCCGDWSRIVTDGALNYGSTVGVLLDPPYDEEVRSRGLYSTEGGSLSADVRAWALDAAARDPRLRVALCGYEGEHDMPAPWRVYEWSSSGAYLGGGGGGVNRANRHRERIWFSPSCADEGQVELFSRIAVEA